MTLQYKKVGEYCRIDQSGEEMEPVEINFPNGLTAQARCLVAVCANLEGDTAAETEEGFGLYGIVHGSFSVTKLVIMMDFLAKTVINNVNKMVEDNPEGYLELLLVLNKLVESMNQQLEDEGGK